MKKYFLLALVVLTGIASSCKYNDDEVWDSVNNLADRVTSLEAVTKQMNSDISAMQNIIAALQNKVSVSEVEKLADGYIIHFSDGTKATIKNGTDGKDGANGSDGKDGADGQDGKDGKDGKDGLNAPVINVAKEKGVYYWTITVDGKTEWLTDDKGNKLAVAGEDGFDGTDGEDGVDGKDGNTPLLKVSSDGYWMVSYDEGEEYEYVKDVYGYRVKAEGSNGAAGDSKFKDIKKNDAGDMVIITLSNGTSYEIPLAPAVTYSGEGYSNGVVSMIKETVELTYTVSQMSNPSVEVIKEEGVSVKVDESKNTLKIQFVPGNTNVTEGKVVILYYNSNQTITSVLTVMAENKNTGILYDGQAGKAPSVTGNPFPMPTGISAMSVDPNNANVGRFSMAGIQPAAGEWLKLYGTGHPEQNVWLEINGVQKSVQVTNGDDLAPAPVSRSTSVAKAKADIVFLVDNSASMDEEAKNVMTDIIEWAKSLSEVMDVQFGCVGQSIWGINGALNITTADKLHDYLSIGKPASGADTYYTRHFGETMKNPPSDRKLLEQKADEYGTVNTKINDTSEEYGECGGIMLHFADENFDFRDGASRFYVYITDEANQPNYDKNNKSGQWSVESVNPASKYYNWGANKGIIYTVMTGEKSFTEEELYKEDPTKFSVYTGGIALKQSGKTFKLSELPITDAVKKSYIFSFNLPEDMEGENEVVITIKDGNHESKYTYVGVAFVENN